jgi:hypothetical protein
MLTLLPVARQPNVIGSPLALGPRGERTACVLEGTTPVYGDLSLVRYRQAASPKAMPQTRNQRSQTNTCQRNACSSTGADG